MAIKIPAKKQIIIFSLYEKKCISNPLGFITLE